MSLATIADLSNVALALVAVIIAIRVFRFDRSRALAGDRQKVRAELREWFQTLSESADADLRRTEAARRARIEEVVDAEGYDEIFRAMRWAIAMLETSRNLAVSGETPATEGHRRRIVVKRRFRQFIVVWARSRAWGRFLINGYTARGWPAIMNEPGEVEFTILALRPRILWMWRRRVWSPQS